MTQHIVLLGAEQVERASHQMRQAAEEMNRAASAFDHSMVTFAGLVERLEAAAMLIAETLREAT